MPTTINSTVSDICQIISDLRGESSTNTTASRIRAVSRANKDFAGRRLWHFYLLKDQSAGTGDGTTSTFTVGSSAYPMRQRGLSEVFVGGTSEGNRFQVVDFFVFKNLVNATPSVKVAYLWYDAANDLWKMTLSTAPSTGDAVTYSYFWEPDDVSLTTDLVICPSPDAIARLAIAEIYQAEDEDAKRNDNLQLAENIIDELIGTDTEPAINQLYAMSAIENQARRRGLGTY